MWKHLQHSNFQPNIPNLILLGSQKILLFHLINSHLEQIHYIKVKVCIDLKKHHNIH